MRRLILAIVLGTWLVAASWVFLDYHTVVQAPHPHVAYADDGQGDSPLVP